jgi:hypothetical protein
MNTDLDLFAFVAIQNMEAEQAHALQALQNTLLLKMPWHSAHDSSSRLKVVNMIFAILTKEGTETEAQLVRGIARQMEVWLYMTSFSFQEYTDGTTLCARVAAMSKLIILAHNR